jgi:hypothetical protein
MHGRVGAVEVLVKAGAALSEKDVRGGYTPLHLAADAGQCDAIGRLVELGAPLETRSTKGWTPLALATLKVRPSGNSWQLRVWDQYSQEKTTHLCNSTEVAGQNLQLAEGQRQTNTADLCHVFWVHRAPSMWMPSVSWWNWVPAWAQ